MTRTEKKCTACGEVKPVDGFQRSWNNQRQRYYYTSNCKTCRNSKRRVDEPRRFDDPALVKRRERYAADPDFRRRLLSGQHESKYGITLDEKDALLAERGGCAACGATETTGHGWHTDHDHACCPGQRSCGKCVRGILCHACNVTLGQSKESIERLESLINYLRRHA